MSTAILAGPAGSYAGTACAGQVWALCGGWQGNNLGGGTRMKSGMIKAGGI